METTVFSNRLSGLIEENRAAEKAFSQAVQGIENKKFAQLLESGIEERIRFAKELGTLMGEPDILAADSEESHPSWLHFHELFHTGNDASMLHEVIQGQKRSIEMYETVLAAPELPSKKAAVLGNHVFSLQSNINALQHLHKMTGSEV